MTAVITAQQLRDAGACGEQVDLFTDLFGESVEVTEAMAVQHVKDFEWGWAAGNLLSDAARAECEKVSGPARAECEKVRAAALAEYEKVSGPALAEYEKVRAAALAEYKKVRAAAFAAAYRSQHAEAVSQR